MPCVKINSRNDFEAPIGVSLLDSALREGVSLPYSCKTGRCGTCKCKVISGQTYTQQLELGLSQKERDEGWILSCVRVAETDLVLEVDDFGGVLLPPAKTFPCRIDHMEQSAPGVLQVKLRLPPSAEFTFLPGQYINVTGKNSVCRSYSLANSNFSDKAIELHIRSVSSGVMSEYWHKRAKVNDLLRIHGPLGTFFLRDIADLDLVFLATGTGIAPIKAMLGELSRQPENKRARSVTILWGGRVPDDLYFNVANIEPMYQYIPVLSRADEDWGGARGYVQQVLLSLPLDLKNAAIYACGSMAMILAAKALLIKNGLPPARFYFEAFVPSSSS